MYIQHKVGENIEQLWKDFESNNFSLYICGLKGIEEGLDEVISAYASTKGKDWLEMKKEFKKQKRWNVEVY
jgi:ferredoxin--NADP+ reductase